MAAHRGERLAACAAAGVVLLLIVYLVIRNEPFKDPNLVALTRIILSLSIAVFGATVPGFLNIDWNVSGVAIRAGGAMALFVLSYLFTPNVIIPKPDPDDSAWVVHYNQGTNAYTLGQYKDAIAHLSQVPSSSRLYRDAVGLKGNAHLQLAQYDPALTAFKEAERVSRDRRETLQAKYNTGLTYLYAKDYSEARKALVPLLETAEMKEDPAVIYNAASAVNLAGDPATAQEIFARFPMDAQVPTDTSSRDIYAKAHWLRASFGVKSSHPDCGKVREEIAAAVAIAPYLTEQIANDKPLDVCRISGGKK